MSDKALKACADYARLNAEIKRLTVSIAMSLQYCKGVRGTFGLDSDGLQYGAVDDMTHLKDAFKPDTDDEGNAIWMNHEEIREYLHENCPCCLNAYELVLQRKTAKKDFGIVKRAIGNIGRAENKRGGW